jgi:hypothetical protein
MVPQLGLVGSLWSQSQIDNLELGTPLRTSRGPHSMQYMASNIELAVSQQVASTLLYLWQVDVIGRC